MKMFLFGFLVAVLAFVALFAWLNHLGSSPRHDGSGPTADYLDALSWTAEVAIDPPVGSEQEQACIDGVVACFAVWKPEVVAEAFPKYYAERLYFRDAFHAFTDLETMLEYMIRSATQNPTCTFTFEPVIRKGIDFYLPWTMVLPDQDGGEPQLSMGFSHLRFNGDKQVIFHQDFWDSADVLVPRVPVANGLIEAVRRTF